MYNKKQNDQNIGIYEPRFYRKNMGKDRFCSFVVHYHDSDLWIGVDAESFTKELALFAQEKLVAIRSELETYLLNHSAYASSFSPVQAQKDAPEIAKAMATAGAIAQTGPMAAVAGAFSEYLGTAIQKKFKCKEIVVENGGDLYLSLQNTMTLSVYAGTSPLSGKVGIEIPATATPLGICTSAGTVGPSTSFGNADAVMVASKNTLLADALATAIGNRVKSAVNIEQELNICTIQPEIESLLIICDGKIGVKGKFELKLIK
jgi:ApbE superfamily uncharacterized protein (UPF0280 family)